VILLAVDTSSGTGSLALACDGDAGWCELVVLPEEWKSTTLHREIAEVLNCHNLTTAAVDVYAVSSGPGAFTGIRIGLTAVKGLAEVHRKPVITVSTLELVATAALEGRPSVADAALAPVLDARRGQVFSALYGCFKAEQSPPVLLPESVGSLASFLQRIRETKVERVGFCGPEIEQFAPEIAKAGWDARSRISVPPEMAPVLARLGLARLRRGEATSALASDANYVRASDAELFWKD
jgi:tRNA threonylcarbamoyladenosine biosynthesis protein TsaB